MSAYPIVLNSAAKTVRQHWFLFGLVLVILLGLLTSATAAAAPVAAISGRLPGTVLTAVILFLMSATLDSRRLVAALRSPLAVLGAAGVNQVAVPLMSLPLLPFVSDKDLRLGLLIAATVPCTMAAASVWTRMANGNDAVSLLVTLLTNTLCFLVIPAWLSVALSPDDLEGVSAALAFLPMVRRLIIGAVLPALLGQAVRLVPPVRDAIDCRKKSYSNAAQSIILYIVFLSAFSGGRELSGNTAPPLLSAFFTVLTFCVGLHAAAMLLCSLLARIMQVSAEDRVAMIFAGSQKTLPVGLLVAQASGIPLAIVPMLMFHASQLFIDTWVAGRIRVRVKEHV